jgi:serine/threonine-protein phosphatase 6 regulatory ankyrin repeat subunit B
MQLLLDNSTDVDALGEYCRALEAASSSGHLAVVQALLANRVNVNAQGYQYGGMLQAAVKEGHVKFMQQLLDS